jgi:hypothetical protein
MANTILIPRLQGSIAAVSLPPIDVDADPYAGVEAGVAKLGAAFAARAALDDDVAEAEAEASLHREASDFVLRNIEAGTVGPDFVPRFDEMLHDAYGRLPPAKGGRGRQRAQNFAAFRSRALGFAVETQAAHGAHGHLTAAGDTIDRLAERARAEPDAIGEIRAQEQALNAQLSPFEQEAFASRRQQITYNYIRGLIEQNPKYALEYLRSHGDELDLAPDLRAALEHEAEIMAEHDALSADAERADEEIGTVVSMQAFTPGPGKSVAITPEVYKPVLEAYDTNPKLGRVLEAQADEVHRRAAALAARNVRVAKAVASGRAIAHEDAHDLDALDALVETVVGAADPARANARMAAVAKRAGIVPPKMQRRILEGLRAKDPAQRIATAKLIAGLDAGLGDGALNADVRAFGQDFARLTAAGFAEGAALGHLDAATKVTPAQEESRRQYFDTSVALSDVARAVGEVFGAAIIGVEQDNESDALHTGAYRPGDDAADEQTLEYDPERDRPEWQPVLKRDPRTNRVFFKPLREEYVGRRAGAFLAVRGDVFTRKGNRVAAWKNSSGIRRFDANCFGFTFAGDFWIKPDGAERILRDEYRRIDRRRLDPGDVIIYRDSQGNPVHSARVIGVWRDEKGNVERVIVVGRRGDVDEAPVITDADAQWPPAEFANDPAFKGQTYRQEFYRGIS